MNGFQPPVQVVTQRMIKPNLNVFYPQVMGLTNISVQQRINSAIISLLNKLITEQGYYKNPQIQVTGWYELKTNERGILSITIGNYAYPPRAAHGMTYIKSLNFDVNTGRIYQLPELFKPDSDYISVLSKNIRNQIQERKLPVLNGFTTIDPNQDYYIADKALVVYFQLYEITPYFVGLPMFPVSVFELQDIAREKGPIDIMATNG